MMERCTFGAAISSEAIHTLPGSTVDTMFYLLLPTDALCNSSTEALSFKVNEEATCSGGGAAGPNRWFL